MRRYRAFTSLFFLLSTAIAAPIACTSSDSTEATPFDAGIPPFDASPDVVAVDAHPQPAVDASVTPATDASHDDATTNDASANDASTSDAASSDASEGGLAAHLYIVDQNNSRAYAVPLDANGPTPPAGAFTFSAAASLRFDGVLKSAYGETQNPGGTDYLWEFPATGALDAGSFSRCTVKCTMGNGSLAIAHSGSILVGGSFGGGSYGVLAYAPDAPTVADAGPSSTLTAASTDIRNIDGLDVDDLDQIFVHDSFSKKIVVYAANASGSASPIAVNAMPAADGSIRFDRTTNTLYVGDFFGNAVSAYSVDATGKLTLLRTITGVATGFSHPFGLVIDAAQNLYVANSFTSTVTVYPPNANGDQAPSRTITLAGVTGSYFTDLEIGP